LLTTTFKDLHIEQQKLQKVILFSSTLTHSQCDAGTERAAGQLSRFYHKRPVASKFAEYKPSGLSCGVQCWRFTASLKQSRKQSTKSRKRFRLSGATCHKDRSTRLWKTYQS